MAKTRKPDLSGHTFGELVALRYNLRNMIDQVFDKLLSGDLTQLVIRPDLTAPCNDESQMLDLEQDK